MNDGRDLADKQAVVSAIGDVLPDVGVIRPPVRVPKGFGSESWLVATDAGEVLVKIRRREADAEKLRTQVEALRLARSAGVPVPELLYTGTVAALGDRPVMVLRYLPGVDAEEALPGMDDQQREALFSELGDAVGRLHGVSLPRFTDRIGTPEADLSGWADAVGRRAERAASHNSETGVLSGPEIAAILDELTRAAEHVSPVVEPALIHHDLYLANVLVHDGRFRALIDLEQAKGWDPLFDFVKLGMWVFEPWPEGFEPFVTAYRRRMGRIPHAEARLAACLALENFVALGYWVDWGQDQMANASRATLRNWMAASYPWWVERLGTELV